MKLLRILQRNGAHATFFDVGNRLAYWPRAAYAEARLGGVGNHTWSHAHLTRLPHWLVWLQLMTTQYQVESQIGWKPRLFRTPYAEHSRATDDISLRLGLVEVFWNVDARDDIPHARVASIVRNVERGLRPGSIILLHDLHPWTSAHCRRSCGRSGSGACAQCPSRSCSPSILLRRISDAPTIRPREAHRRHDRGRRRRRRVGGAGGAAPWSEDADAQHLLLLRSDQADVAGEPLVQHQDVVVLARAAERLPGAGGPRLARLRAAQRRQGAAHLHRWSPLRHRARHAAFVVLAYGHTWRSHGFTCSSRLTGLMCTNGHGHGLFLSRESFRLW